MPSCLAIYNRANVDGGAVYLLGSSATVSDCDFSYNVADRMGGAIASNTSSSVTISSSNLTYHAFSRDKWRCSEHSKT